jgi:hypothetical protein
MSITLPRSNRPPPLRDSPHGHALYDPAGLAARSKRKLLSLHQLSDAYKRAKLRVVTKNSATQEPHSLKTEFRFEDFWKLAISSLSVFSVVFSKSTNCCCCCFHCRCRSQKSFPSNKKFIRDEQIQQESSLPNDFVAETYVCQKDDIFLPQRRLTNHQHKSLETSMF